MTLFSSWDSVLRILLTGLIAYVVLIVFLRVSGKRTLAKLNAFDLVVTVSLGSTLATVLLSKDIAVVDGLVAFALLIAMQYAVAWGQLRSAAFRRMVKSEPALLLRNGAWLDAAMRRERVARDEVLAALRSSGVGNPGRVAAVVLETDGTLSVIERTSESRPETSLADVENRG